MLAKKYRGLKEQEIAELFKKERVQSISSRFFRINWINTDQKYPQFVVICSKKFHKSAVERNKVRRKLYEMVRQGFSEWTEGLRVAILVKNSALDCSASEFKQAFFEIMMKSELFKKKEP